MRVYRGLHEPNYFRPLSRVDHRTFRSTGNPDPGRKGSAGRGTFASGVRTIARILTRKGCAVILVYFCGPNWGTWGTARPQDFKCINNHLSHFGALGALGALTFPNFPELYQHHLWCGLYPPYLYIIMLYIYSAPSAPSSIRGCNHYVFLGPSSQNFSAPSGPKCPNSAPNKNPRATAWATQGFTYLRTKDTRY